MKNYIPTDTEADVAQSEDEPTSVPELLQTPIPDVPKGKVPIRILVCGVPEGVNSIVHELHIKNFAEVILWSPPLPSPVQGEVIRILTRYHKFSG